MERRGTATPRSAHKSALCAAPGARRSPGQVFVMGMSRSGSSLTTSIVASLLGGGPETWRGSGAALASDTANSHGYFERADAVSLNYRSFVLKLPGFGPSWTSFPLGWASDPRALVVPNESAAVQDFRSRAAKIVADMRKQSRGQPWVLKDVRFARTLPLWWPLVEPPSACLIPVRHPAEVAESSIMGSTELWRNYMLSALVTARTLGCPTMLIRYDQWLSDGAPDSGRSALNSTGARRQLAGVLAFLRCAGLQGLPREPPYAALAQLVRHDSYHHRTSLRDGSPQGRVLTRAVRCLWDEVRSGRALSWPWDARLRRFHPLPC